MTLTEHCDRNHNGSPTMMNTTVPVNAEAKLSVANYGVLQADAPIIETGDAIPEDEQTTYGETLMNLLNGMIGSGALSMPLAFLNGGLILASIVTPMIGLLSCYCIHLLLSVNVFAMKATGRRAFDYHEIAEYAFLLGPTKLRRFHVAIRRIALGVIFSTQLGACCVYYVFIATIFRTFLQNRLGPDHAPSQGSCMFIVLPILIVTMWIRNYKHLARLSTLTNFCQIFGIIVIIYFFLKTPIDNPGRLPAIGNKIPQFFVSTLFIYEGSSVSMSLSRAMKQEREFRKPLGVLNVGVFLIIIFYTGFGALGYIKFGEHTKDTITESLPAEPVYDIVQLGYAIVVLGTYPVLLYVPIQVIWGLCRNFLSAKYSVTELPETRVYFVAGELALRTFVVLLTFSLAIVVPRVELILSLVGSLTSSSVAIIIPSIVHTVAFWPQQRTFIQRFKLLSINLVILTIGLSAFCIGFYFSLQDIIDSYRHP